MSFAVVVLLCVKSQYSNQLAQPAIDRRLRENCRLSTCEKRLGLLTIKSDCGIQLEVTAYMDGGQIQVATNNEAFNFRSSQASETVAGKVYEYCCAAGIGIVVFA